jgi:hypothetical protein
MFARKSALVAMLVVAATTLVIASAFAQVGPTNPSGGTGLRQTVEEGSGPSIPAGFFSRGFSFDAGWSSWLGTFAASRYASTVAPRSTEMRSILAVARRQSWKR